MASTATSNGAQRSASRAQPVQRGRGGGGKYGGRRPTCLQGGWPDAGRAAKEEAGWLNDGRVLAFVRGVCQGLAQQVRAEGEALCGGTSAMPISGGTDIMQIIRMKPLTVAQVDAAGRRRRAYNPLALC
ncbi:hypothetical protein [Xenorhabdus doucetiae]|uniref:hypothetical protein n=1 Tax=Xenorhabdus doucetiae TaxID=351671 RepID=UPI0005F9CA06|nr:hypothetical protein [Xenorhabdus doucetiae]